MLNWNLQRCSFKHLLDTHKNKNLHESLQFSDHRAAVDHVASQSVICSAMKLAKQMFIRDNDQAGLLDGRVFTGPWIIRV